MVNDAHWAVRNSWQIHYAQVRPFPRYGRRHLPMTLDCSAFVTTLARWAGVPDPNGASYNGTGFTGTLLTHLRHTSKRRTRRGDLVVFGGGTGEHVVMLVQGGMFRRDPLIVSHGAENEPQIYPLSVERSFFGPGVQVRYLRIKR